MQRVGLLQRLEGLGVGPLLLQRAGQRKAHLDIVYATGCHAPDGQTQGIDVSGTELHHLQIGQPPPGMAGTGLQLQRTSKGRLGRGGIAQGLVHVAQHGVCNGMIGFEFDGPQQRGQRQIIVGIGLQGLAQIVPGSGTAGVQATGRAQGCDGVVQMPQRCQHTAQIHMQQGIAGRALDGPPQSLPRLFTAALLMHGQSQQTLCLGVPGSVLQGRQCATFGQPPGASTPGRRGLTSQSIKLVHRPCSASSATMLAAASLPSYTAVTTRSAPRTMSPPAKIRGWLV